jgi:hypothetical protein
MFLYSQGKNYLFYHIFLLYLCHELKCFLSIYFQEIIAPFYIDRQPELLYFLYSELDQPPPAGLSAIFSPFKKSEGSLSPLDGDQISSIKSDASYNITALPSKYFEGKHFPKIRP